MNIKELGNYQLINGNTDNPVLIGTPTFLNFSMQSKSAVDPSLTTPMFTSAQQLEVNTDLYDFIYNAATDVGEADAGCGAWWYITDIKSEYIIKFGAAGYYLVLSATVIVVYDNNIPASTGPIPT